MDGTLQLPGGMSLWWRYEPPALAPPGGGQPAVGLLVPPGGRTAAVWPAGWLRGLREAGWGLVLVDLPGQGRSDPGDGPLRVEGVVAALESLLAQHGWARPHVVGAGLGGAVALELAARGYAAALTLVATSGWYTDPAMAGAEEPVVVSLVYRQERHTAELMRRSLLRELRALAGPADLAESATWAPAVEAWLQHGHRPADGHRPAWLAASPLWDRAARLTCPVTVVHGDADPLVPLAHGQRLAATVPGARLDVVTGAGHLLGSDVLARVAASITASWAG